MMGNGDDFRTRPGPQAHNRGIAESLTGALAKAFGERERQPEPLDHAAVTRMREIVREELAEFTRQLPALVMAIVHRSRKRGRKAS